MAGGSFWAGARHPKAMVLPCMEQAKYSRGRSPAGNTVSAGAQDSLWTNAPAPAPKAARPLRRLQTRAMSPACEHGVPPRQINGWPTQGCDPAMRPFSARRRIETRQPSQGLAAAEISGPHEARWPNPAGLPVPPDAPGLSPIKVTQCWARAHAAGLGHRIHVPIFKGVVQNATFAPTGLIMDPRPNNRPKREHGAVAV